MIKVDLSSKASLTFEKEKLEAQNLLKERKGIVFQLDWGIDPFDQPIEPYRLAVEQFQKELVNSAVKAVSLFPLTSKFFLEPLKEAEKISFEEGGYKRIDLFRRDRLSEFLGEFNFSDAPLVLEVDGALWWVHPSKFPFIQRKSGQEKEGLLFPNIETDEVLEVFEAFPNKERFRLLTEETLALEWEGLEILYYIPAGVTKMGMRVLKGFEAAGGTLLPV